MTQPQCPRVPTDADTRGLATHWGLGKHIWDVPLNMYSPHYLWVRA